MSLFGFIGEEMHIACARLTIASNFVNIQRPRESIIILYSHGRLKLETSLQDSVKQEKWNKKYCALASLTKTFFKPGFKMVYLKLKTLPLLQLLALAWRIYKWHVDEKETLERKRFPWAKSLTVWTAQRRLLLWYFCSPFSSQQQKHRKIGIFCVMYNLKY